MVASEQHRPQAAGVTLCECAQNSCPSFPGPRGQGSGVGMGHLVPQRAQGAGGPWVLLQLR